MNTTTDGQPLGLGLSEGLGPRDKAEARALAIATVEAHGMPLVDELAKGGTFDGGNLCALLEVLAEKLLTVERERCAKLCEAARPAGGRQWDEAQAACFEALSHVAAVIRGPNLLLSANQSDNPITDTKGRK